MTHSNPHHQVLADARSLLFVPGNRPERYQKALASGADAVVLDLEDSVPAAEKQAAREAIGQSWGALQAAGLPLVIRINATQSAPGDDDLTWLETLAGAPAVMVPKAESRASLASVAARWPGSALVPLIETAAGHAALAEIAAAPGVLRLAVGHIDFMADTGIRCSDDESELAPLRFAVAMATRLAGLATALDGVTVDIGNDDRLRADTHRAQRFGFGGKLCIHPRQVAVVHAAMAPGPDEVAWAKRVIAADAAAGGAAVQLDGRMVDAPVVLQARRVLARMRNTVPT
jgi:citrate lyase subunit beta / citryl-CoA lyase